jgi:hypothetical protein
MLPTLPLITDISNTRIINFGDNLKTFTKYAYLFFTFKTSLIHSYNELVLHIHNSYPKGSKQLVHIYKVEKPLVRMEPNTPHTNIQSRWSVEVTSSGWIWNILWKNIVQPPESNKVEKDIFI